MTQIAPQPPLLKDLQGYALEVLLVVDRFCREHGITYFLGEGTLLGAVRHQGFIPWDDDVDILMKREDYERFVELAAGGLPAGYVLDSFETNPLHWTVSAKVQIGRDTPFFQERWKGRALSNNPGIDIFPLDPSLRGDGLGLETRGRVMAVLRRALWVKSGFHQKSWYGSGKSRLRHYYPAKAIGSVIPMGVLKRLLVTIPQRHRRFAASAPFYTNFGSLYPAVRSTVERSAYEQAVPVQFEGHELLAPAGWAAILSGLYGDYLELPPPEAQVAKHSFSVQTLSSNEGVAMHQIMHDALEVPPILAELHQVNLSILLDIDRACRNLGITYYLAEGTMLGAVRHGGFIPWDDDVDIAMPRADYERFLSEAPAIMGDRYQVQHAGSVPDYWSPFAKVRLITDDHRFRQAHISHLTSHNGPLVDVFPLDSVAVRDSRRLRLTASLIRLNRAAITQKFGMVPTNSIARAVARAYGTATPLSAIHRRLAKLFTAASGSGDTFLANFGSYYPISRQVFPVDYYGEPRMVVFEGHQLPIPQRAEDILASIYGDWKLLPHPSMRFGKHHFGDDSVE